MKKLFMSFIMLAAIFAIGGCSAKTTKVGCENLPECVPGPLGDCINK